MLAWLLLVEEGGRSAEVCMAAGVCMTPGARIRGVREYEKSANARSLRMRAQGFSQRKRAFPKEGPFKYGAAGRIRTHDPLVRSQVLYPTELQPLRNEI